MGACLSSPKGRRLSDNPSSSSASASASSKPADPRQAALAAALQRTEAALDWLLRRVGRDLASLTQLFDRLDRAALAAQRRLTVPFLRETLGDALDPR